MSALKFLEASFFNILSNYKMRYLLPGLVAQLLGAWSHAPKWCTFNPPGPPHISGLQVRSPFGRVLEATNQCFYLTLMCSSLFSLPAPLKSIKKKHQVSIFLKIRSLHWYPKLKLSGPDVQGWFMPWSDQCEEGTLKLAVLILSSFHIIARAWKRGESRKPSEPAQVLATGFHMQMYFLSSLIKKMAT